MLTELEERVGETEPDTTESVVELLHSAVECVEGSGIVQECEELFLTFTSVLW